MHRQKDFMKPIRLFNHELWIVNMNHITGPTSQRDLRWNALLHTLRRMTHGLNRNISCVSAAGIDKDITYVKPQRPVMKPGPDQLCDAPFRGSIRLQHALYKVRGAGSGDRKRWSHCPGNISESLPTWIFNLQHISQSDTILLPLTHFNV